jgi:hypothetical protein
MMASMPNPPSRANPSRRGIAVDICPQTPPCFEVVFSADQTRYPVCPKLARPQIPDGFAVQMGRDYFKQAVALTNARIEDVYKCEKAEIWKEGFVVSCIKISIPLWFYARARHQLSLATMWIGLTLKDSMIHSSMKRLQSAESLVSIISWVFDTIGMKRSLPNSILLSIMMQGKLLSFGQ